MTCEHCGAPLLADRENGVYRCTYCGNQFLPLPDANGVLVLSESSLSCPVCATGLSEGSLETYLLKYCGKCHGMLIPMRDLVAIVDAQRARLDPTGGPILPRSPLDADRHLHCPDCGGELDAHAYGGGGNINVDSCERCGHLWVDGGELRRVVTAR